MQEAEVVLSVLRERGGKGLPCEQLYRQMVNIHLGGPSVTGGAVLRWLYGEIGWAGGSQGLPSMSWCRASQALRPCLRAVSM
jgi:hypothetical protein